jgi:hypothetical protein
MTTIKDVCHLLYKWLLFIKTLTNIGLPSYQYYANLYNDFDLIKLTIIKCKQSLNFSQTFDMPKNEAFFRIFVLIIIRWKKNM